MYHTTAEMSFSHKDAHLFFTMSGGGWGELGKGEAEHEKHKAPDEAVLQL